MKPPFTVKLDPKPRIVVIGTQFLCDGRDKQGIGFSPEMAWAVWYAKAFPRSFHMAEVLRWAVDATDRRLARQAT